MDQPIDIAALRHDYVAHGLRRADLHPDPIKQFARWFGEAAAAKIRDVNAMSLATVRADGTPAARIVLLKAMSDRGFVFLHELRQRERDASSEANPVAALNFFWPQLERQIRIEGAVEKTSREESEEYFHSRPLGSQLARGRRTKAKSSPIATRSKLRSPASPISTRAVRFRCRRIGVATASSRE